MDITQVLAGPWLYKHLIVLFNGQITIQRISIRETNLHIHWIEIYLVDSVIYLLNNCILGPNAYWERELTKLVTQQENLLVLIMPLDFSWRCKIHV